MAHELPDLPYDKNALAPHISAETLEFHHDKHHAAYVTNLNNLIPGTEFEAMALEEIIKNSSGGIFNNAAQVWNHTFYWNCLSPSGGGERNVALQITWVTHKVVIAIELQRVDKQRHDHCVTIAASGFYQRKMAFVQEAHCWNQPDYARGRHTGFPKGLGDPHCSSLCSTDSN